ncbi:MAG: hypothetical protein CR982_10835, partial [Candidatus Cloacimonadota bacterium]
MISLQMKSQVLNVNPDPNGEPWLVGDGVLLPPEKEALIPEMFLTPESAALSLPEEVYNDELIYFPPIFYQQGGSCVQAAEIGYVFTYEMNRLRNVAAGIWDSANIRENLYHHLYTYNFLNQGNSSMPTFYTSGFSIIKENGCPMYNIYDDPALYSENKFKYWMTDFNKYVSGMRNRITEYYNIYFDYNYSSLETIKHWIADHNSINGSQTGGLAVISVNIGGWNTNNVLPAGTPHEGEKLITQLGTTAGTGHALTIVGYDDNVKYDFNGDGLYTTDIDITGDNVINLLDREIGAFKIANSWGKDWKNQGFIWLPYRAMPGQLQNPDTNNAYICKVIDNNEPQLAVKVSTEYPHRRKLRFNVGYAKNANQNSPISTNHYNSFNYQGGLNDMRGAYQGSIEFGLNYGYFFLNEDVGKIFLIVNENEYTTPYVEGTIDYFSILDYRWGEVFELFCDETNVAIVNDGQTMLSIDYDLIPHESNISNNLSLFSNMVSRFTPTVDNNATLTVKSGVRIDMYDSEIHINSGGKLVIEDNATFLAKRGDCKIIIDGNITVGSNVNFIAEDGAELEVILNNNTQVTMNDVTFNKAKLKNYGSGLKITGSEFYNSYIETYTENKPFEMNQVLFEYTSINSITKLLKINDCEFHHCEEIISYNKGGEVKNSDFLGSHLFLKSLIPTGHNINIGIINNQFTKADNCIHKAIINIEDYIGFNIKENFIGGSKSNGISVTNCGRQGIRTILITDNKIQDCDLAAIQCYNSTSRIYDNIIFNNQYGVKLLNNSSTSLSGNESADYEEETQVIKDNDSYEIYASANAYPWYMRYNVIRDHDNGGNSATPTDPIFYYDYKTPTIKDARYNCWGSNFDPVEDIHPYQYITITPTWCPSNEVYDNGNVALATYQGGITHFENELYAEAEADFKTVIQDYPKTIYAADAMKMLLNLTHKH